MSTNYSLSLSAAGAYKQECIIIAKAFIDTNDWAQVKKQIVDDDLIMINSVTSRNRIGAELIKRLKTLTPEELAFLAESQSSDTSAIIWTSVCRTYPLLRAFSEKLLKDRYAQMRNNVSREVYEAFVSEEAYDHPELEHITESSQHRIQGRVFEIARDCSLLNKEGEITPLYPSPAFVNLLKQNGNAEDLNLFPKVGPLL